MVDYISLETLFYTIIASMIKLYEEMKREGRKSGLFNCVVSFGE